MNRIKFCDLLIVGLLFSPAALAQVNARVTSVAAPEPFPVNVSGPTWEAGELRTCSTYSNHPKFLLCDDDLRTDIVIGYLDHKPINREQVITSLKVDHSKRFLVQFSKAPWKEPASDNTSEKASDEPPKVIIAPNLPLSKPDGPDDESRWDCSKDKVITCTLKH